MLLAHRLILRILNAGVELDADTLKGRLALHGVAKAPDQVLALCSELQSAGLVACRNDIKAEAGDAVRRFCYSITPLGRKARGS